MKALRIGKSGVALTMAATLALSACSSNGSSQSETPGTSETNGTTGTNAEASKKISLNWFITAPPNSVLPSADKDFVRKTIEEKFNVDLHVEYMAAGSDYNTKINALLASTPPDMWRDANPDGGVQLVQNGLIADLTDFVSPQTMPNYFKHWVSKEVLQRYQVEGGFYLAPLPYRKKVYRSYYIRKDWLDALNLKMPTNYKEYMEVLHQFTFKDPDGNGKNDTYGFTTSGGGTSIGYDWPEEINHGLLFPGFVEGNRFILSLYSPKMEQVLDDIARAIDMQVVDPDWYLNKNPQHIEKAIQGRVGVVVGNSIDFALDNNKQGIQYRSKQINPKADWRPFTLFGDRPVMFDGAPSSPFLFAKSVATRNPEKVRRSVEILEWLAGEEGFLLTQFGQEGKHYIREGNTIKPDYEAYTNDIIKNGDFLRIWSFFTEAVRQPEVFGLDLMDNKHTDRDRGILKWLEAQPTHIFTGGVSLIPPTNFDLAGVDKRRDELLARALFEDKSGKKWPLYLDELRNKYKVKDLEDAYTENVRSAGVIR
ncbi:extracellular solute-binding protein [Paenibacillus sp. MBLB4367]|uniref:extracellular solute-binding protein n=1 Tax=Paenibacillus sp. MBLB4367 TaxID=3384767 RepID=UPI003908235B